MLSNCLKNAPQVDKAAAVELQFLDGCPPCRRQADYKGKIVTPDKVIHPALPAWVVQKHSFARSRINGVNIRVFTAVAALARQCQVSRIISTAARTRDNVFNGE
jgi:hypothetical protein